LNLLRGNGFQVPLDLFDKGMVNIFCFLRSYNNFDFQLIDINPENFSTLLCDFLTKLYDGFARIAPSAARNAVSFNLQTMHAC